MLKNSYLLIFCLFALAGVLFAQTSNPQPNEPHLLVDDGESMMMSYADANLIMTNKYFGLKERLNSRRWQGYQGNIKVAEPKFFEIAGFNEEAKLAAKYQIVRQTVFWSGAGMIFLGGLITVTKTKKNDNKWQFPAVGIGLLATGIGLDAIWYFAPPNHYPLSKALAAATKYNKKE
uniref:Uncharacterized protein n=1 Tax=candidate division WOR-3 bacterium TaxID=2052148 RepID=A0A7C6EEH9_UNCW3